MTVFASRSLTATFASTCTCFTSSASLPFTTSVTFMATPSRLKHVHWAKCTTFYWISAKKLHSDSPSKQPVNGEKYNTTFQYYKELRNKYKPVQLTAVIEVVSKSSILFDPLIKASSRRKHISSSTIHFWTVFGLK